MHEIDSKETSLTSLISDLSPGAQKIHNRLQTDFAYFAPRALKIQDKAGELTPFRFNKAQQYIHERAEDQLRRTGRVRIILLKGRQQGGSTYIGGRFYFKSTRKKGKNVFILSHEAQTTEKLFQMVDRYQTHCEPSLRPTLEVDNRRMLIFAKIGSSYTVGTAGNDNVGRGGTLQYFHGSEVAFWGNTEGIETGIMQSIADLPDTEVFLESTANGMQGMFYEKAMMALGGEGEYELVFVPWFWQDEYYKTPPTDFLATEDERHLAKTYGLTEGQLFWRRQKIQEFRSEWKFKQEYPCNPMEAFQTSGEGFFDAEKVDEAMMTPMDMTNSISPRIGAMDPAGATGKDDATIGWRQGGKIMEYEKYERGEKDAMHLVYKVDAYIKKHHLDWFFIDMGYGEAIVSRLHELNSHYRKIVVGVWFSGTAINNQKYSNKRAEMYDTLRDSLNGLEGPFSLPNDEAIRREFLAIPPERHTSNAKMLIPSKAEIKEKLRFSPNILDMIGLLYAVPVKSKNGIDLTRRSSGDLRKRNQSPLTTLRRTAKPVKGPVSITVNVPI